MQYDSEEQMSTLKSIAIRLSTFHRRLLKELAARKGIDRTNIIRLAITEMAEREGLLPKIREPGEHKD